MIEVQVRRSSRQGREDVMYPANAAADALARIAGTWTLTEAQIRDARRLGIRVIEVGRNSYRMPTDRCYEIDVLVAAKAWAATGDQP